MQITIAVVSTALAMFFSVTGTANGLYLSAARKEGQHLRMAPALSRFVGGCQLSGAIGLIAGLWWRPLGIAAGIGLMLLMVGAVLMHRRVGESMRATLPAVVVFGLAGLVVYGQITLLLN